MKLKRLSIAAVTALATLALVDVGLTLFALDDGVFMGREVPPFSDASQPRWRFWLRSQRLKIEGTEQERPAPEPDTELGWTNRPLVLDRHGNVAFNSIARGSRVPLPPAPGDLRIALVGESSRTARTTPTPSRQVVRSSRASRRSTWRRRLRHGPG
jgi:hypothetical protein